MLPTQQSTTQQQFDLAYWASQPPEVQALRAITDADQRAAQAATLATNGFTIDVPIMVWGWDAYLVMTMREQFGYTWVPSALQPPVASAPGDTEPGVAAYNPLNPPPGSILVSTNIQNYPPYSAAQTIYLSVVGDTYPDGATFSALKWPVCVNNQSMDYPPQPMERSDPHADVLRAPGRVTQEMEYIAKRER
jgi:hypothetical protein